MTRPDVEGLAKLLAMTMIERANSRGRSFVTWEEVNEVNREDMRCGVPADPTLPIGEIKP